MNLFDRFRDGLAYADFLIRYGTETHQARWQAVYAQVTLTPEQRRLLG